MNKQGISRPEAVIMIILAMVIGFVLGAVIPPNFFPMQKYKCKDGYSKFLLENEDDSITWYSTEHKCGRAK